MVLSRAFMRGDPAGEDRASTEQPPVPSGPTVAIVHDYLTQRGGAERVVLEFARAFSGAPIHTSVFNPDRTYPELDERRRLGQQAMRTAARYGAGAIGQQVQEVYRGMLEEIRT